MAIFNSYVKLPEGRTYFGKNSGKIDIDQVLSVHLEPKQVNT